jgi:hypothetical protein
MLFRHETPVLIAVCLILLFLIWATMPRAHAEDSGNTDPAELTDVPEAEAMPEAVPELAPQRTTQPPSDRAILDCCYTWQKMAPWSFAVARCEFFVNEHERQGIKGEWPYSFAYGMSGSSMRPGMSYSAGGMTARGLMDATELQYPRGQCLKRFGTTSLHDPQVSIATHVYQAAGIHRHTGRTGFSLMRAVFLPRAPDGGRARQEQRRWESIAKRMEALR